MMRCSAPIAALLLLAGCDRGEEASKAAPEAPGNGASAAAPPQPAPPTAAAPASPSGGQPGDRPADPAGPPPAGPPPAPANPCLIQGTERLAIAPLRAVGTEPFWGARIEGRCVTYSHPEDQAGTRVWTRYAPSPGGGTWSGALGGRRFELSTRSQPGCSDGMSDKVYPIAVELLVGGERRSGCAEPL